ncbi:Cytochrome b5 reductase 4 [Neolecta irregularis DAH-3]|uniref:Cytochrome b5 reductase 4 n=1 Tax=Neolecta irregularis (strain DAH-3) TaxID=1198029 RepID=A0A1U7LR09_NEOID|nr:Cytochrome b5 reductase 4 [Neolecta irregularis DAH-3]|eukprot:OLL25013.1 Cytochrome b5 reductase 4 [Neolecta irregularis DAH-3]
MNTTPPANANNKNNTFKLPPARSNAQLMPSSGLSASTLAKPRQKVVLTPGHSPLDWATLKSSGINLRGISVPQLLRLPPSELKKHRKKNDAWMAFHNMVYNVTAYLPFHPGGEKELMRAAGRDGTKLFMETHSWVNINNMLDKCLVGFLIPEPDDNGEE